MKKKDPKKIKKSLETVSNPGSNPRGGGKNDQKKENGKKKSFFWLKIESSSNLRSNLELHPKINEKKGPKKIKKIPGDGLEPGFEPTRGGKNDQKKEKTVS